MGLDNGIYLTYHDEDISMSKIGGHDACYNDVCYWRKFWQFRERTLTYLGDKYNEDFDGTKKPKKSGRFATKKEAEQAELEFKISLHEKVNHNEITFEEMIELFLNFKKKRVRETTYYNYGNKIPLFSNRESTFHNDKIYEQLTLFDVLYSSGISTEIINNYDDLKDKNATHAWGLLKKHYPDYFSNKETAISNLKKLSNIDEILKVLENLRKEKDKIIKAITDDFVSSKKGALNLYKNEIDAIIHKKIETLNSTDIEEIKAQINKIKSIKSKVIINANAAFEDSGAELSSALKEKLNAQIKALFGDISNASESAKGSETVTKTKTIDKGAGFLWWRSITGNRYEEKDYQVTRDTLNAGPIRIALQDAIIEINDIIKYILI